MKLMNFKYLSFIAMLTVAFVFTNCKSEPNMKKQQAAFHVDANGNLLNKKGDVVKQKGAYKLEGGFYVDSNGEKIKRDIDKAKEKISKTVGESKEKLTEKMGSAKEKLGSAVDNTKQTVNKLANRTTESVKANFNELFNTKAVGTIYPLDEITFNPESHRITGMSKADVEGLAEALKEHPESRIQVQVHTADAKSNSENKKISALRADVVKNMLVALGVNKDQISAKGLGLSAEDAQKAVANTVEVIVEK